MPVPGSTHVNPAADLVADEIMESMKKVGAQQYSTAAVDGSYTHRRAHTAGSWSGYTMNPTGQWPAGATLMITTV